MVDDEKTQQLPQERQFWTVLYASLLVIAAFLYAFIFLTLDKARHSPSNITSNWFEAWGTWGGGLATSAAFLITAFSIAVASAHTRQDRRDAAMIRESKDMAQARLLIIYPVDTKDVPASYRFYRIDNRSNNNFFDVTVPYVDRYYESDTKMGQTTPESAKNTLEFLPQGELLAPYRTQSGSDGWFTEVRVYAKPETPVRFAVHYADAAGLQWKQYLDGTIERVLTTQAVPASPRMADTVQPYSQLTVMPKEQAQQFGGSLARYLSGEDQEYVDSAELLPLSSAIVESWARVDRIGTPAARPTAEDPNSIHLEIAYAPKPTPPRHPWCEYFKKRLKEAAFNTRSFRSQGNVESLTLQVHRDDLEQTVAIVADAIEYANDQFEENELTRARAVRDLKLAAQKAAAEYQAQLDERTAKLAKPGRVPWHPQSSQPPAEQGDVTNNSD